MDLHHKTYERRGMELDSDLIALCHECHMAVHGLFRAYSESVHTLKDVTELFVRSMVNKPKALPKPIKRGNSNAGLGLLDSVAERQRLATDPLIKIQVGTTKSGEPIYNLTRKSRIPNHAKKHKRPPNRNVA